MSGPSHGDFNDIVFDASKLLDKSCVIYGGSGSGKSTAIQHLMYELRGKFAAVIVFSASDKDNGMYSSDLVPAQFVYEHITPEVLIAIRERQSSVRRIYDTARNINVVKALFDRVASSEQRQVIARIRRTCEDISRDHEEDAQQLQDSCNERVMQIMLRVIDTHKGILANDQSLSTEERFSLRWMHFNPRILIVFDDCTSDFKALRGNEAILEQIFRGRHFLCTSIIALHSPSVALPMLRLNAHISIFTDSQCARSFASTTTNALSSAKKREFERYAARILTKDAPFTKMAYIADVCYLCTFDRHGVFSVVPQITREFARKCARDESREKNEWMQQMI